MHGQWKINKETADPKDLLQQAACYVDTANSILARAEDENRDLTAAELKDLERLERKWRGTLARGGAKYPEVRGIEDQLRGLTFREDMDKVLDILEQPLTPPWRPAGTGGGPTGAGKSKSFFNRVFPDIPTVDTGGFRSFGEFFEVVSSGRYDPRLTVRNQHLAGTGAAGGFCLPVAYTEQLFEAIVPVSIFLPRAQITPLTAGEVPAWCWDDLDQSGNLLYGGFRATWQAEGAAADTTQRAKLRQITLRACKLSLYTSLSRELQYFSGPQDFSVKLQDALRRAIAAGIDESFLLGDGVGKPLGVLSAENPALIGVNRAGANAVSYVDVVNMVARMHPAALEGALWVANPSVLPQLLLMRDEANNLIWQPSGRDATPDTLLGKPLFLHDRMPALGARGDLLLCNPRFYQAGLAPAVWLDADLGSEWAKDLISLRAITFVAGVPGWNKPYTPPEGNTLSWSVCLDVPA